MLATCVCGAVSVRIDDLPTHINDCNCTLCRKSGGAWGYFAAQSVGIEGPTTSVTRRDMERPAVELHFCGECGTTTHWALTDAYKAEHPDADTMGMNMRLFDPDKLAGVELRFPDGKNWTRPRPSMRRDPVVIGPGFRW